MTLSQFLDQIAATVTAGYAGYNPAKLKAELITYLLRGDPFWTAKATRETGLSAGEIGSALGGVQLRLL